MIDPERPLIVTGFSLGGGVAPLVGLAARDLLGVRRVRVVTFGAPACGDAAFGDYLELRLAELRHFQLGGDPIPHATRALGFVHSGHVVRMARPKGWLLHTHDRHLYRKVMT